MKCIAIKSAGGACNANALHKSRYCFRHDKKVKREALLASSAGGQSRKRYNYLGKSLILKTPEDIKNLMEQAINRLWTGKMSANNPAGAIGYLSKIFLEAHDKSELEIRMEALEKRVREEQK